MNNNEPKSKDLGNLLTAPTPFEMDLPWGNYDFSRRFYDVVHDWGIPTEKEVAFIKRYIKSKDYKILDLTCGGGRHALGLAESGYNITAIDIGGYPVEQAQKIAGEKDYKIHFIRGDVRDIKYKNDFDLAFLICGQLGHFSPEDAQKIFKNCFRALTNGGTLIVHLPVFGASDKQNSIHWYQEKRAFYFPNPSVVHREQYYYPDQRVKLIRDFAIDTTTRENHLFGISEKNYIPEEITGFGRESGFKLIETFGSYDRTPLAVDSKDNIYVFSKK